GGGVGGGGWCLMGGGGTPAHIRGGGGLGGGGWGEILAEGDQVERILGNYDTPQGSPAFLEALAGSLSERYGWSVTPGNLAVVNGSQTAFFYLLNLFAGSRRILLPLCPEYIGYADQLLPPGRFVSVAPEVELMGDHRFKYHIDFDRLRVDDSIGAMCVSRPTNPTGNVLTDAEMSRLEGLAGARGVPLIVDNAYGAPFPDIIFNEVEPLWTPNTILVMSLSKLGLPGTRTGIILGPEDLISRISAMHAVAGLANGNIGQAIATPLLRDGRLYEMSREVIRPFYLKKSRQALEWLDAALPGEVPYRIHVSEGALFLWIWFEGLPISSEELYQRLKSRGVLVIPGHYFFYGLEKEHPHQHRCLRLSYAQGSEVVQQGVAILAEEVRRAYGVG
ncbi:MAG TPA: valine--pyruvate transaminase, partial [Kiritimatiellia bacterium]|nr:valine--pyruvate transaminase [Kiritimatiellia bacterium]